MLTTRNGGPGALRLPWSPSSQGLTGQGWAAPRQQLRPDNLGAAYRPPPSLRVPSPGGADSGLAASLPRATSSLALGTGSPSPGTELRGSSKPLESRWVAAARPRPVPGQGGQRAGASHGAQPGPPRGPASFSEARDGRAAASRPDRSFPAGQSCCRAHWHHCASGQSGGGWAPRLAVQGQPGRPPWSQGASAEPQRPARVPLSWGVEGSCSQAPRAEPSSRIQLAGRGFALGGHGRSGHTRAQPKGLPNPARGGGGLRPQPLKHQVGGAGAAGGRPARAGGSGRRWPRSSQAVFRPGPWRRVPSGHSPGHHPGGAGSSWAGGEQRWGRRGLSSPLRASGPGWGAWGGAPADPTGPGQKRREAARRDGSVTGPVPGWRKRVPLGAAGPASPGRTGPAAAGRAAAAARPGPRGSGGARWR